jgi:purine-binding chemotaxis protein CheW
MSNNIIVTTMQYLFFIIDNEKYALETNDIQEIIDYSKITRVPKANKCIKGITNVRGELIPVIDPKIRFNIGEIEIKKRTSFIIINILSNIEDKKVPIALIVDYVEEVEEVELVDILPAPVFGTKIDEKYIKNIIRFNEEYISLLNIDHVLNLSELSIID